MIGKLKIDMPMLFKGNPTWYDEGTLFNILDKKEIPKVGLCYKVGYMGFTLDGWVTADSFEIQDSE